MLIIEPEVLHLRFEGGDPMIKYGKHKVRLSELGNLFEKLHGHDNFHIKLTDITALDSIRDEFMVVRVEEVPPEEQLAKWCPNNDCKWFDNFEDIEVVDPHCATCIYLREHDNYELCKPTTIKVTYSCGCTAAGDNISPFCPIHTSNKIIWRENTNG